MVHLQSAHLRGLQVGTLAKKSTQLKREQNTKYHTTSHAPVTEFIIGKCVDKEKQVSDWSVRPLSEEQIEYAALDAAVSPVLSRNLFKWPMLVV